MKELKMNEEADWKTILKYGISYPLCLVLVASAPLVFGPMLLLYIIWHRNKYFTLEENDD